MDTTNLINKEKFLCGIPTEIEGLCLLYPVTLREIAKIGIKNFYAYLNIFTLTKEDVNDFIRQNELEIELTPFQFHLANAAIDENYLQILRGAFKFFLHETEITVLPENEALILGKYEENRIVREEEFQAISEIVSIQHCVDRDDVNAMNNPSNSKAAQIIKKIKEGQRLREKKKGDSQLDFFDLVGSLAAGGNGLNIINIWDITYYAFNDQFKRMQMREEYDNGVRSLLAGAKPEKIKLKHWVRKTQDEEK